MAMGLNHVHLVGAVARPPDLRYTPAGRAVLRIDVAGDTPRVDDDGETRTIPWYQRVTVFGPQAERVADHLAVGSPVWIDGRLEERRWTRDDGRTGTSLDVVAMRIEKIGVGARDPEAPFTIDAREQPRLRDASHVVRLIGNMARDVEVRTTDQGHALALATLAVGDAMVKGETTDTQGPKTHFVDLRAWRGRALACAGLLKGDPVYVEGRLVTDAWTDGEGERRWSTRVEVERTERIERLPRAIVPAPVGHDQPSDASVSPAP